MFSRNILIEPIDWQVNFERDLAPPARVPGKQNRARHA